MWRSLERDYRSIEHRSKDEDECKAKRIRVDIIREVVVVTRAGGYWGIEVAMSVIMRQ